MENKIDTPKKKSSFKEYFITIFLAIFVVVFINKYLFFSIKVPSKSMYPTIKVGDRINTFRIYNQDSLKRG